MGRNLITTPVNYQYTRKGGKTSLDKEI